jgi:hypothetical protein
VSAKALLAFAAAALAGCSQQIFVDAAMMSAYRPPAPPSVPGFHVLGGDMHCHVVPPDPPWHVTRELPETLAIAQEEGLDFVLLTPHVRARFFEDERRRAGFLEDQRALAAEIARARPGPLIVLRGLEYTDFDDGHLSLGFADPEAVLAELPVETARAHPEQFFEKWVAAGGVMVINHPVLTPIPSVFSVARRDLSWRPFEAPGTFPPEIAAADRLAQGVEVFNLAVTHMRDGLLIGDRERSLKRAALLAAHAARAKGHRVAAIGGTDSHTQHLRVSTYVLAEARTPSAIRDAIVAARTCVRSPEACTFEARVPGGPWRPVGSSLTGATLEVRARGEPIVILRNGEVVAEPRSGEIARVTIAPDACSAVYAKVGEGYSSPIYVGCPF